MGFGDDLLGSGMARGAKARGKRIAFGDGMRIIWGPWSKDIFRGNPNVASPGDERAGDIEWLAYYKGSRIYNRLDVKGQRWIWNFDFRAKPGEVFFSDEERRLSEIAGEGFVVIEPNIPRQKSVAANKDWGLAKYQAVADALMLRGFDVVQTGFGRDRLQGVRIVATPTFRHALAVLSRAALYIGPEGGLHHGAAAVSIPAVVVFGGFIPPQVTGYDGHVNLTGGAGACGSLAPCGHCKKALDSITIDEVVEATTRIAA
jgi:hypothetical protein